MFEDKTIERAYQKRAKILEQMESDIGSAGLYEQLKSDEFCSVLEKICKLNSYFSNY